MYDENGYFPAQLSFGGKLGSSVGSQLKNNIYSLAFLAPMDWETCSGGFVAGQLLTRKLILELVSVMKAPGRAVQKLRHPHWGATLALFGPPIIGFQDYDDLP